MSVNVRTCLCEHRYIYIYIYTHVHEYVCVYIYMGCVVSPPTFPYLYATISMNLDKVCKLQILNDSSKFPQPHNPEQQELVVVVQEKGTLDGRK